MASVYQWMKHLVVYLQVEPVRHYRPSEHQHPKYNVDSLLNCPHDVSNQAHGMEESSNTCLLGKCVGVYKGQLNLCKAVTCRTTQSDG